MRRMGLLVAAALPTLLLAGCTKGPSGAVERFTRAAATGGRFRLLDAPSIKDRARSGRS